MISFAAQVGWRGEGGLLDAQSRDALRLPIFLLLDYGKMFLVPFFLIIYLWLFYTLFIICCNQWHLRKSSAMALKIFFNVLSKKKRDIYF